MKCTYKVLIISMVLGIVCLRVSVTGIVSLFPQLGGKWQLDAVALLREMLLNRSVDMDVKVEVPVVPRVELVVHSE